MRSADGSYLYFAYDVAYLRHKLERVERAVYVLGADHHGYVSAAEGRGRDVRL